MEIERSKRVVTPERHRLGRRHTVPLGCDRREGNTDPRVAVRGLPVLGDAEVGLYQRQDGIQHFLIFEDPIGQSPQCLQPVD